MDVARILDLVKRGLQVIGILWDQAADIKPALTAIKDFITGAQTGEVTDEQFTTIEDLLDRLIAEFNIEMPE